ncbi:response regulator transcription factor [Kribbella italica]|uniref:DNA-binding response OmpR family regulator n=1 Tax=Kribbella italica TaxID=1540520 RepID=A0A7W9J7T5_9ACTN|nr:response regulator transcription factor [Kribbella italica]MBB5836919.1 DNA-binding response OmpR family regulator [Kribbella italica]
MPHILVVEDDADVRAALLRALRAHGYATSTTPTGLAGLAELTAGGPDLVLLDLGLPDVDGGEILRMARAVSKVPVIVVTARDEEPLMVRTLHDGADDYLVKPFSPEQLHARIQAVLRRSGAPNRPRELSVGGLTVELGGRVARLDGSVLDLTPREFDLLAYLAERPGQVVTRRQLIVDVWQLAYGGAEKTVDVHLSWLRRKLGETAREPRYLRSVRGVGVCLTAPETS